MEILRTKEDVEVYVKTLEGEILNGKNAPLPIPVGRYIISKGFNGLAVGENKALPLYCAAKYDASVFDSTEDINERVLSILANILTTFLEEGRWYDGKPNDKKTQFKELYTL